MLAIGVATSLVRSDTLKTSEISGVNEVEPAAKSEELLLDHFLHRLDEVRALSRGSQLGGLLVGLLTLAVLEQGDPLHRLVKDAPEGLEADFLGGLGAALALDGLLLTLGVGFVRHLFLGLASALRRVGFLA